MATWLMRAAAVWIESRARCEYRAVVWAWVHNIGRNGDCDSVRCIVDRVTREMGAAGRGLNVVVTEQLSDRPQGLPRRPRAGRKGIPNFVSCAMLRCKTCVR